MRVELLATALPLSPGVSGPEAETGGDESPEIVFSALMIQLRSLMQEAPADAGTSVESEGDPASRPRNNGGQGDSTPAPLPSTVAGPEPLPLEVALSAHLPGVDGPHQRADSGSEPPAVEGGESRPQGDPKPVRAELPEGQSVKPGIFLANGRDPRPAAVSEKAGPQNHSVRRPEGSAVSTRPESVPNPPTASSEAPAAAPPTGDVNPVASQRIASAPIPSSDVPVEVAAKAGEPPAAMPGVSQPKIPLDTEAKVTPAITEEDATADATPPQLKAPRDVRADGNVAKNETTRPTEGRPASPALFIEAEESADGNDPYPDRPAISGESGRGRRGHMEGNTLESVPRAPRAHVEVSPARGHNATEADSDPPGGTAAELEGRSGFTRESGPAVRHGSDVGSNAHRVQRVQGPEAEGSAAYLSPGNPSEARNAPRVTSFQQAESRASSALLEHLIDRIQIQVRNGGGDMFIRLRPAHLGYLEIQATTGGAGVVARILAESAGVRDYLESNLPLLHQGLQEQGLKIERIDVVLQDATDARHSAGPDRHAHGETRPHDTAGFGRAGKTGKAAESEILVDISTLRRLGTGSTFHTIA